ncbi:MAG: Stp1/IreP family PP2C-type Ser/Thr phosphatase [Ardenticatenaceae bacterium]|nr:Stp1/IreP family PP2C-type Ser/Thr phosphatase [Anaerolineales bacterium]MCB8940755.1 Stp1/IreP family PP2C-type Ser/Thr phosphatase [Ardenticatenaceae bacterium]MCB8972094.1 Stp1/IreP family PP2C-type Ser/Thr phosphatase [Ardenticatenaceae bacterium]
MSNLDHITAVLRTDTGQVRGHNEDFVSYWEPSNAKEEAQHGWLYIVADGVGGADAGEVASELTSDRTIQHYLNHPNEADWGQRLLNAMQSANTELRQYVLERNDNSRMATTMVAAVLQENHAYIANVGDSRGYLWRNGRIQQITKDQSLVAKLVEEGAITEEEALFHPRRNVILYSLGSERSPQIDLFEQDLEPGDRLLLCSDGLTRHVLDEEIALVLSENEPAAATEILINRANERGGEDNISVAIVQYAEQTAVLPQKSARAATVSLVTAAPAQAANRSALWIYTLTLGLVQTALIFLVWFLLRV